MSAAASAAPPSAQLTQLTQHTRRLRRALVAVSAVAAIAVAAAAWFAAQTPRAQNAGVTVSAILPPDGEDFSERSAFGALSPDGRRFAFVTLSAQGERRIWLRALDSLEATPLFGTEGADAPFWSPDGKSLAYFANGQLMRLDIGGGIARPLCTAPSGQSGSWGETGLIVIATDRGLESTTADGGNCEVAIPLDTFVQFRHPSLLPGDSRVIYEATPRELLMRPVYTGDLVTARSQLLLDFGVSPTWVAPGFLVYGLLAGTGESGLYAQRLAANGERVEGQAVALTGNVRTSALIFAYSVSAANSLVYLPGLGDREQIVVNRTGEILDTVRQRGSWTHRYARTHPWLALGSTQKLLLFELPGNVSSTLAIRGSGGAVAFPVWSPADSAIAYGWCGISIVRLADRSVQPIPLGELATAGCVWANDWSSDGQTLILSHAGGLATLDLESQRVEKIAQLPGATEGALSPDMRWLAFVSGETGTKDVFVAPFGRAGRPVRISRTGGRTPRWRGDGRELFFETPDGAIMSVAFSTSSDANMATALMQPTLLFRARGWSRPFFFDVGIPYDVRPDGQQFVLRLAASSANAVLMQNWTARMGTP